MEIGCSPPHLLVSVSAAAQQPADSQPAAPADAAAATQTQPSQAQPSASQSQAPAGTAPAPTPSALPRAHNYGSGCGPLHRARTRPHEGLGAAARRWLKPTCRILTADPQLGSGAQRRPLFSGRMDMGETVDRKDYLKEQDKGMETRLMGGFNKLFKVSTNPWVSPGWSMPTAQISTASTTISIMFAANFSATFAAWYSTSRPRRTPGKGRFLGRVWVEDQDFNIVRLNGTYSPAPRNSYFFHMDSWRLNLIPGYWVPAYIYSEEGDFSAGVKNKIAFKAQTRIWGYDLKKDGKDDELTQIRVDSVKDESATTQDASPLQAERIWQQQAEDNVIERLTSAGLLAPEGDVDHILQTVVNNLEVTNNIDLPRPVRTRVLLTAPLETFSVGNTIVISRGLIDVLPDEASLAAVLVA